MRLPIIALALTAAACSRLPPQSTPPPPSGRCDAGRVVDLVGRPASAELGADALARSGARRLRWIRPGDVVTMDYSPARLNIHLDAAGRVERLACG